VGSSEAQSQRLTPTGADTSSIRMSVYSGRMIIILLVILIVVVFIASAIGLWRMMREDE
jgi:flagellar basal body-associated protein FliL